MKKNQVTSDMDLIKENGYTRKYYSEKKPAVLWIVLLAILIAPVALWASKETPDIDEVSKTIYHAMGIVQDMGNPVDGLMQVEDAWAIEDTRQEANEPLVSRMYMNGAILGYDRESRTFYCTLGMNDDDEWPEASFTAKGSEGLKLAWIDDYMYDYRNDAIEEGYRYELLAWTESQYEYVGLVFTGLPIVTLHADKDAPILASEDVGADIHIASGEYEPLYSRALVHKRGGGAYSREKESWRIEFRTLDAKGRDKKIARSVLGMDADSDFLLIANSCDPTAIRNHICWQLWKDWREGRQFAELESRLVEVFRGDEYMGIYQLMEYVDPVSELKAMGGNLDTDLLVKMITVVNDSDRPLNDRVQWDTHKIELRYAPPYMTAKEAFSIYEPFDDVEIERTREMSDEEFISIIETHFDVQDLLDYFLFVQVYNLRDNARNNVFVWAMKQEDGTYQYRLSPWDMDYSLCKSEEEGPLNEIEIISWELPMINRMLELDIRESQKLLYDMFMEKRAGQLSDDAIYQWVDHAETMINKSGAYLRESEKWLGEAKRLNLAWMSAELISMQKTVEMYIREVWCPSIKETHPIE